MLNPATSRILKAFLLTIAGAILVGLLKDQQAVLAMVLLLVLAVHLGLIWRHRRVWAAVVEELFYLVTFGTIGFLTESWGTMNGHWTYYHLPEGQSVPTWVPIAWAIASVILCKSEASLKRQACGEDVRCGSQKPIAATYLLGMLLPLTGESICIALGVWSYHWPYKVLGVPLLALMLIAYAHLVFSLIRSGGAHLWGKHK